METSFNTSLAPLLLVALLLLAASGLLRRQPPTIVYMPLEHYGESDGWGCLPILLIAFLGFVFLMITGM